ncbi:lipid II flippase MurJ [Frigidibacter albus]
MRPVRLIRGFVTVGGWTLGSRVVGFIRDMMIAAFVGAGPVAEAYFVAAQLPNMFRRFFAEGAFNTAFVPMFSKRLEAGENPQAFAEEALAGLVTVVIGVSVVAMAVMPWLVLAMAWGFAQDERWGLATLYGWICFPYILFISVAALLSGLLNAGGRFIAAAAAPVMMNVVLIAAMLLADLRGWDMGLAMSWSMPVAGIVQAGMLWIAAARMGFPLRLRRPKLTPDMRRLLAIAFPSVLAGGVVQINLMVGKQVSSLFEGAVAWLNYADRLYQPAFGGGRHRHRHRALARHLAPPAGGRYDWRAPRAQPRGGIRADPDGAGRRGTDGDRGAADLCPVPARRVHRGRGGANRIGAGDLRRRAAGLRAAKGDPAAVFRARGYAAPVPLCAQLHGREPGGRPRPCAADRLQRRSPRDHDCRLGDAGAGLWWGTREMGEAARFDDRLRRRLPRIVLAAALMGLALWGMRHLLGDALYTPTTRYGALALLVLGGMAAYALAAFVTGAARPADFTAGFRRQR